MRTNLLLIGLSLFIWQSITIVSTLYNRIDSRVNQLEIIIKRLDNEI
jgi:hypothetical protein